MTGLAIRPELYTIVVVEDDAVVRRSTAVFLRNRGYRIIEADNGASALEQLRAQPAQLLLTDLRMPGLDGLQLLQTALEEFPELTAIVISGMGTIHDAIEALRLGAVDYITKPVPNMNLILHSVERAIRHSELLHREKNRQQELEELVAQRTRELREQNRQLQEEMRRRQVQEGLVLQAKKEWERTVDAMPEMIAIIDRNHQLIRTNKTLCARVGDGYDNLLGRSCCQLFHGTSTPHQQCPHSLTLADGLPHKAQFFESKLGVHLEVTTIPYSDPDGTLIGSVHIARDISEQVAAEKEKEKLQSQLLQAQKLESVGQLAAGIAHEINTPTQFIGTNFDFLEEAVGDITRCLDQLLQLNASPDSPSQIAACLQDLDWEYLRAELPHAISQSKDGVRRITSIVRAMKEFSHPGSKEKELYDLNRIINTTVTVTRNEWKYVAEVRLELDENLPMVPLLVDEMGQVLLNMLVNAAHAIAEKNSATGTPALGTITVRTRDAGETVQLTIADNGNGIPEAIRQRIFDPFFTTKKVGQGTGQGLAISHDVICVKHGGGITFTSESGQGTEFIISLPKAKESTI